MRTLSLIAALALPLATPALAQQTMAEAAVADDAMAQDAMSPAEEFTPVAPDSNWFVSQMDCRIDGNWDGDVAVTLIRHEDHHDLSIYDPALKSVKAEKMIPVRFGAGGKVVEGQYQAVGYRDGKSRFYVANVDDALIEAVAAGGSFQFYREALELDLDMKAFPPALAAMRKCEAEQPASAVDVAADAEAAAAEADAR